MARTNAAKALGERTREVVLDAALEVFAGKGYRGGSLDDIAQRSGVGRSALLYHFGSKEGLLLALLARRDADTKIMQETGQLSSGSATVDLLSTLRRRSPGIRAAVGEMKLSHALEAEAADVNHPARQWVALRASGIRQHFAAHFAQDVDSADASVRLDADALSAITLAVVEGLEAQWLVDPDAIDFDRALEVYEMLVLGALRPAS